jgi:NTE family protein
MLILRRLLTVHFFLIGLFLNGCMCPNQLIPCADPPPLPKCCMPERIRVALVLGGGGAKGLAHVGVLEVFEKANIPIDLIVGCSAGSIVGSLYADYPDAEYVRSVLEPMSSTTLLDINIFKARFGLSQGYSLVRVLRKNLNVNCIEDLSIPLVIVATDLKTGELVPFAGGPIIPAVKASCAIPLVFVPVPLHGRVCVDGGVADPVPAKVAKYFGAEFVIAVDLGGLLPPTFPNNLFSVATRSAEITLLWQSESCVRHADVIIKPQLEGVGTFSNNMNEYIIEAGRRAAREALPQILEHLSTFSIEKEVQPQELESLDD